MKNFVKILVLSIVLFGWFLGFKSPLKSYLFDKKILQDDYRYGDLYRLSNLPEFKDPKVNCGSNNIKQTQNVHLYLAGDSFTESERVNAKDFSSKFYTHGFSHLPNAPLVLGKEKKVLIIETVERHVHEKFNTPWFLWSIDQPILIEQKLKQKLYDWKLPYNDDSHVAAIFGSDLFLKIKEWKAELNRNLFGKINDKVFLSTNKKDLFYYLDADAGFKKIVDAEIDKYVKNMNVTRENYLNLGFNEVYFSIIPNKSSIMEKGRTDYNHLLERIENHKDLKVPLISIYKDFQANSDGVYLKGDSHWNCTGQQIWLNKVNAVLEKK